MQIRAKLFFPGELEQFVVRHRGPEKIGEPRGECPIIYLGEFLSRTWVIDAFFAEEEARGSEHADHGLADAGLEGLFFL